MEELAEWVGGEGGTGPGVVERADDWDATSANEQGCQSPFSRLRFPGK